MYDVSVQVALIKPLGPTQILFASNDARSVLTAWDVSYGAPLWTTPLQGEAGMELQQALIPAASSTSARLLFVDASAKRLLQCSIHAPAGLVVSKKRSRLRDVLGVFRSSVASAQEVLCANSAVCS